MIATKLFGCTKKNIVLVSNSTSTCAAHTASRSASCFMYDGTGQHWGRAWIYILPRFSTLLCLAGSARSDFCCMPSSILSQITKCCCCPRVLLWLVVFLMASLLFCCCVFVSRTHLGPHATFLLPRTGPSLCVIFTWLRSRTEECLEFFFEALHRMFAVVGTVSLFFVVAAARGAVIGDFIFCLLLFCIKVWRNYI